MLAPTRFRSAVRRKIVRNAPRHSGFSHAFLHALVKRVIRMPFDLLASPVEHAGTENFFDFQPVVLGFLSLQEFAVARR